MEFIDSLADRPLLLLLCIMGGAVVMMGLTFVVLALLGGGLGKLFGGGAPVNEPAGNAVGGTKVDGLIDGVPSKVMAGPGYRARGFWGPRPPLYYVSTLVFETMNMLGIKLLVHRDGMLNRPLEALPPLADPQPEWLAAAGYVLRVEPVEIVISLAEKFKLLEPFSKENIINFSLEGNELRVELNSEKMWSQEQINELAKAGAALAKALGRP